jgi:hypothetical protein
MALALKAQGYNIIWVYSSNHFTTHIPLNVFDAFVSYSMEDPGRDGMPSREELFKGFHAAIKFVDDKTDIYIAYNEPNWFVTHTKQITNKPVIWDLHDLTSERDFVVRPDEASEFKLADAIITQGPGYSKVAAERRPDLAKEDKIVSVLSAVPRVFWPDLTVPLVAHGASKLGGIVYEGGVASGVGGGSEFRYRWWQPFMAELVSRNIPVSIQVASGGQYPAYAQAGVRVCQPVPYRHMLQSLTIYDWGLVGNAVHHPAFDNAWPNKLFEYIAAGLPVMVHDAKQAGEWVQDMGVGVVINSVDDAVKAYPRADEFKEKVLEVREKFVMENEVKKLEPLFQKLMVKE